MRLEYLKEGVVMLPGGVVLEDGHCFRSATLRPLAGREEEWLAHHPQTPNAAKVTWLLQACLLELDDAPVTLELVRQLLVGDRDYLVLQLRRFTLGDDIHAVIRCPACENKMDTDFRASEVAVESRPQTAAAYTLNVSDRVVRFRLPTGGDQETVLGMPDEAAADELFNRCLLDDGGKKLSAEERLATIEVMERLAPHVELELDLTCPDCNHRFLQPFDTTAYFFDELSVNSRQLLREVHALALYYHWSESDILSLRRDRRREYLGLLHDSLRPQV
ncbi:MAG TPA: hypothetical protein VG649_11825 [Candidatus Angelobacter sp.]|jgi:hypothetical protein|nr:hypothetical protein [Candidatus Angelobacter sp.]